MSTDAFRVCLAGLGPLFIRVMGKTRLILFGHYRSGGPLTKCHEDIGIMDPRTRMVFRSRGNRMSGVFRSRIPCSLGTPIVRVPERSCNV